MKSFSKLVEHMNRVADAGQWFFFEGPMFGKGSTHQLKVLVEPRPDECGRKWQAGCEQYAKRLPSGKRKEFNRQAMNPLLVPVECMNIANRKAVTESGCIIAVAAVGPVFNSEAELDDVPEDIQYLFDLPKKLPARIREYFKRTPDGRYEIPAQEMPPDEFVLTAEDRLRMLEEDSFVSQCANFHGTLTSDGSEALEDDIKNSRTGSTTTDGGTT